SNTYWQEYPAASKVKCETGPQSPVNLTLPTQVKLELGRIAFEYPAAAQSSDLVMANNGHSVELLLNPEQYGPNGEAKHQPAPTSGNPSSGAGVPPAPPERAITIGGSR